jgi:DNA mismatch repair protein MutS2
VNAHALAVLEFPRVLDLVAERASSSAGAARVRGLAPVDQRAFLEGEHRRVAAVRSLIDSEQGWSPEPIPELGQSLARLRVEGAPFSGPELLAAATLLRSSRRTGDALTDEKRPALPLAVLAEFPPRLVSAKGEEDAIARVVDDAGEVRDGASPLLSRLRRELRAAEGELVRLLERIMGQLESHQAVSDMSVTVRNGRYVIPVRRGAAGAVGGIVHDTSGTGATVFIEPPAAVEFGNRIRELEAEERREVDRILLETTDRVRPLRERMIESLDALTELDSLYARARFARDFDCSPAELCLPDEGFAIRRGRHPLLLARQGTVVPFDLEMLPGERTLLVSGPNTGGKTVLLKAIALISALFQAGVPAPVGAESRIAIFDDLFADIGDEQSIEASLSTFSAHLKNLGEILARATARSLVLIDELGSGTDPLEGAALGGAILEELTRRGTLTVATTHLGALKELAAEVAGVVNASLQFDAAALAPTYQLLKGIPGRSYGLSIARRLGLPEHVLRRSEERVPQTERDVNALLAELETRETALAEREREATAIADDARERVRRVAEREKRVREREREAEKRARQEARRYLLDARQEIERTIRDLRKSDAEAVEDAAKAARKKAEELAAKQGEQLERLDREEANAQRRAAREVLERSGAARERRVAGPPEAGDYVEVGTLGGKLGRLMDVRDGQGVVAVGAIKMTVPMATLRRAEKQAPAEVAVPVFGDMPEVYAPTEIDLRGMRADEVDEAVLQAVDAAVRADLRSLRIIHGKGTGALRERVTAILRKDTRVRSFRLGVFGEGGTGVTVAEF